MDQYLVYGNPIKQSKSPTIHTAFAKETNQNIEYKIQFAELNAFEETVKVFIKAGCKGANEQIEPYQKLKLLQNNIAINLYKPCHLKMLIKKRSI